MTVITTHHIMTDPEFSTSYTPPFRIHVIGFGKRIEPAIAKASDLGYDEVASYMSDKRPNIIPGEKDIMAIICVDDNESEALQLSKTFYDANVLTLVVTTKHLQGDSFDSMTEVRLEDVPVVVKSLLDPLLMQGKICFDFNDMSTCLRNSGCFFIEEAISTKKDGRLEDAINQFKVPVLDKRFDAAEFAVLIIYHNPDMEPPLAMREIVSLNEYLSSMPENIDLFWAIFRDDKMSANEIRISTMISGKKLDPSIKK